MKYMIMMFGTSVLLAILRLLAARNADRDGLVTDEDRAKARREWRRVTGRTVTL